jgi:hypothetical protein
VEGRGCAPTPAANVPVRRAHAAARRNFGPRLNGSLFISIVTPLLAGHARGRRGPETPKLVEEAAGGERRLFPFQGAAVEDDVIR